MGKKNTEIDLSTYVPAIKSGRAFNGFHRDGGTIVHLVQAQKGGGFWSGKALCSTEPGWRGNGWTDTQREANCPKCLERKTRIENAQALSSISHIKAEPGFFKNKKAVQAMAEMVKLAHKMDPPK